MQFLPVSGTWSVTKLVSKMEVQHFENRPWGRISTIYPWLKRSLQLDRRLYFSVFINIIVFVIWNTTRIIKIDPVIVFWIKFLNAERNYIIFKLIASCIVNGEICYLYDRIRIPILFLYLVKVSAFSLKKNARA